MFSWRSIIGRVFAKFGKQIAYATIGYEANEIISAKSTTNEYRHINPSTNSTTEKGGQNIIFYVLFVILILFVIWSDCGKNCLGK